MSRQYLMLIVCFLYISMEVEQQAESHVTTFTTNTLLRLQMLDCICTIQYYMMVYAFFVDCILPGNMSEDTVFQSNKQSGIAFFISSVE